MNHVHHFIAGRSFDELHAQLETIVQDHPCRLTTLMQGLAAALVAATISVLLYSESAPGEVLLALCAMPLVAGAAVWALVDAKARAALLTPEQLRSVRAYPWCTSVAADIRRAAKRGEVRVDELAAAFAFECANKRRIEVRRAVAR